MTCNPDVKPVVDDIQLFKEQHETVTDPATNTPTCFLHTALVQEVALKLTNYVSGYIICFF